MIAEGEVANILSHFDSDYVMSIVRNHLDNRFTYSSGVLTKPNIVVSYDITFKSLIEQYPFDRENILTVRQDSFAEIIDTICKFYNFRYYPPQDDIDLYTAAYLLYECFVSKFDVFVTNFFADYVILNKDILWDALDMNRYKKDKDITTIYGKKAYDDIKMAVIVSKMNEVLYFLLASDIDMPIFINACYPMQEAGFINSLVYSEDFYKNFVCPAIQNPNIITDIKLKIHQKLCDQNKVNLNQLLDPVQNTEETPPLETEGE